MPNEIVLINVYEITYPDFIDDHPNYSVIRTAETPGKAKYAEFLEFSDAWDMEYIEYLKHIKCRKVGQSVPKSGEEPFHASDRIENVNQLIREIGNRSHRSLYYSKEKRYSEFHWACGRLWLTDHYTGIPMIMEPNDCGKSREQKQRFSSGGTMWGLVQDFRDYIFGDDDANHNNGYGGLYCPHWGYPEEDMEAIRAFATGIGYLKPREVVAV